MNKRGIPAGAVVRGEGGRVQYLHQRHQPGKLREVAGQAEAHRRQHESASQDGAQRRLGREDGDKAIPPHLDRVHDLDYSMAQLVEPDHLDRGSVIDMPDPCKVVEAVE